MVTETSGDRAAQCSVPNITFSNEASLESSRSGGPTTPNTPVVLLAKPRDPGGAVAPGITEIAPVSLLQRPLSAPTSMVSSSPSTSSLSNTGLVAQSESAGLDVDASIVEALKSSKDRLYVLKLGESMESLIGQGKLYAKVELQPASSYQRLLVHRCAEFYHLTQESNPSTVTVIVTSDSRIPSKRIAELVPPEESVLPAFQIMRRVDRSKTASRATSVDGNLTDDGDDSTRSQGSGSKKKQHMTIEEREAAYHKARSRIFMDFEEKDASTSSGGAISSAASTVSYTGGSTGMSSIDGDGASTAPTESEYSGPAGRGKDAWFAGSFGGNNGRGMQTNGTTPTGTTLRSTAPPFTSPNVAPPPPKGTVHYLPPISDTNSLPDTTSSHSQQTAPSGVPAGGYPPYPQPAIYPYYVPYFYPMPYPQPVSAHPSQPTNQTPDGQRPDHPANQQQPQPPAPAGYAPHLPPPAIVGQPYPGYMWLPAHPGYIPVPPHASTLPAQPTGASIQPPPLSQPAMNISRPASQASHQSHASFDQRSQHSPPQQPPPAQQHSQGNPYTNYPPPPNAFQASHLGANVQPAPSPLMHPNAPPQNPVDNRLSGPGPIVNAPFNPHPVGPNQQPPNGGGPWNNSYPPGNATGPNSAVMAQRPNAVGRTSMPPPTGRPQNIADMSRPILNAGASGGAKRGMPRNPWGAYSYGPGVGGMHTANVPPGGPPLQTGPIGPAGGVLRAPEGLNIRILPPITLENHSTGSSNGSSSSLRKRNANAAGVTLKSPGDETSSASSSSSSSKRTYTSTASSQPQHHPLPERPDWVLGSRPQQGGAMHARTKGPGIATSTRQLLQPSPARVFNQSSTPSPVNGTSAVPSSTSSVSGSDTMSKEFPPLNPGAPSSQAQTARSRTPASPAGAWNNALTSGTVRPGSAGVVSPSPTRPGSTNATATEPFDSRLDEPDKKFERPPPKSGVALFNPRVSGSSRSKSRDNSLGTEGQSSINRSAVLNSSMESLSQTLEGATLTDKKAEDTTIRADEASSGSGTSYTGMTDAGSVDSA